MFWVGSGGWSEVSGNEKEDLGWESKEGWRSGVGLCWSVWRLLWRIQVVLHVWDIAVDEL